MKLIIIKTSDPVSDAGTQEFTFKVHEKMEGYDPRILDAVFTKIRAESNAALTENTLTHSIILVRDVEVPFYLKFNAVTLTSYACPMSNISNQGWKILTPIIEAHEREQMAEVDTTYTVY